MISPQVKHQHVRMCLCIHTRLQGPFYLIARSSWLPWEGQFPWTKVTMPRLEDHTEGPSGYENYEIPHPCALQNTGTGAESEIVSAYKELLVYLEWKTTIWYKTKWRSLSSSEKGVMGWKYPWLGFPLADWQTSQTNMAERRERAWELAEEFEKQVIKKKWVLSQQI